MLSFSQIEIVKLLLKHILQEKIEFATITPNIKSKESVDLKENNVPDKDQQVVEEKHELKVVEEITTGNDLTKVEGIIAGETDKAVLLKLNNGTENWFPKSTIKSQYSSDKESLQTFLIDSWIIERNKIVV